MRAIVAISEAIALLSFVDAFSIKPSFSTIHNHENLVSTSRTKSHVATTSTTLRFSPFATESSPHGTRSFRKSETQLFFFRELFGKKDKEDKEEEETSEDESVSLEDTTKNAEDTKEDEPKAPLPFFATVVNDSPPKEETTLAKDVKPVEPETEVAEVKEDTVTLEPVATEEKKEEEIEPVETKISGTEDVPVAEVKTEEEIKPVVAEEKAENVLKPSEPEPKEEEKIEPTEKETATAEDKSDEKIEEPIKSTEPQPVLATAASTKSPALIRAEEMKREAARIRMEAEKMATVLAIEKIASLEKKLENAEAKKDTEKIEEVKEQILALRRKLDPSLNVAKKPELSATSTTTKSTAAPLGTSANAQNKDEVKSLTSAELEERVEALAQSPSFIRKLAAKAAGFDDDTNVTAVVLKMNEDEQTWKRDGIFGEKKEIMTPEELKERVESYERAPQFFKDLAAKMVGVEDSSNATEVVTKTWEMELGDNAANNQPFMGNKGDSSKSSSPFGLFNSDETDDDRKNAMLESQFPKSTRKEGEAPSVADAQLFLTDVLSARTFSPTDKPEPINGGFIIRGTKKMDNSDDMVEAIDKALAKSPRLSKKLSFYFIADPTPVTEEQVMMGERDPVVLITGADINDDSYRIGRAIVSSIGFGSIAFYSIFPFFMNEVVSARLDETLSVGTSADLSWFTDLSNPLFFYIIALQLAHEGGHWAVALANDFEISFPTLIPSPIFGVTSTITRLKTSPKNRQQLFDFALAGPLVGIFASLVALFVGLELTANMDAASFSYLPALPAAFLKGSSLVAGTIDAVMGDSMLQVDDPVNAFIKLHPLAIAGYAGLMVNALNLTPFGRTDGGRVALALFGRSGTQLVSIITLVGLLLAGFSSSDAFLLYFIFISFFQGELEIPLRNEVDEIDFTRVVLGIATGVLGLLILIPTA